MIAFASYIVYMISLMCDYYQSSVEISKILDYVDHVLSILLIIEVLLRLYAFRKEFFASSWNRFDLIVAIFVTVRKRNENRLLKWS